MAKGTADHAPVRRRVFAQSESPDTPQGGMASPTTFLLLVILALFFVWSMRRRKTQEERFRELRRQETVTHAEESARNIAHIMRQAPTRATAEAAATQGLAAAAPTPAQPNAAPAAPGPDLGSDNGTAEIEIAEREMLGDRAAAAAEAERAAEREAAGAAERLGLEGPSDARRVDAARAAAEEAAVDTADAQHAVFVDPIDAADIRAPEVDIMVEDASTGDDPQSALRAGLAELEAEATADVPFGAVTGDGTATCPPEYPIKGNQQSRIYHEPGQSSYAATIPEFCFASPEAAVAAGFRQSRARGGRTHE